MSLHDLSKVARDFEHTLTHAHIGEKNSKGKTPWNTHNHETNTKHWPITSMRMIKNNAICPKLPSLHGRVQLNCLLCLFSGKIKRLQWLSHGFSFGWPTLVIKIAENDRMGILNDFKLCNTISVKAIFKADYTFGVNMCSVKKSPCR